MKNQGISLISLIITIIVIIILAAIVIFSGLNTPDSAQFAGFTQQVDNVYQAVMGKYGDLKARHAVSGDYRTDEQIYLEIATGSDQGQYNTMNNLDVKTNSASTGIVDGTGFQHIRVSKSKASIGMALPEIRQSRNAWYVTKDGKVFNANGYIFDGKTYFNGSVYFPEEIPANDTTNSDRATAIYAAISGEKLIVEMTKTNNAYPTGTAADANTNN